MAIRALVVLLVLGALSEPVRAEQPAVAWHPEWQRFRTSEAIVTGAMLLPIAGALFLYPEPEANLHGGVLFDDAIRNALVADGRAGRERAWAWSNRPYFGLLAFPLLVDVALVTWGIHGAGDVALEMLAMDLESYALSGAFSLTMQKLGRVRPSEKGCATDPDYSSKCDNPVGLNQSFVSGHTSIAFTGAGLTCAHHRHLPLYGGGLPDRLVCLTSLVAASATGVLRIMSDDHYASDVLLGMGVGLVSGYLLPEWLHYGSGAGGSDRSASAAASGASRRTRGWLPVYRPQGSTFVALLTPQFNAGYAGVALSGGY